MILSGIWNLYAHVYTISDLLQCLLGKHTFKQAPTLIGCITPDKMHINEQSRAPTAARYGEHWGGRRHV